MQYYSQIGQDKYVNERIFQGMENGFFVDIGAHDGINISNSYFFEKHKNWNGICVEPIPEVYELLRKNRKCICIEGAIFTEHGYQDFMRIQVPAEMLNAPTNEYDVKHKERLNYEIQRTEMLSGLVNEYDVRFKEHLNYQFQNSIGSPKIIKVKTFTLQSILDNHNVNHIDLLSVDTEGSELAVLQSIDFKKVKIECIVVENNFQKKNVEEYLTIKGYRLVEKLSHDDIFLHSESKFSVL
jgi:FkbM family methyltransferase